MLLKTKRTTLFQIFCEFIVYSWIILKSSIDPDDNYKHAWPGEIDAISEVHAVVMKMEL